MTPLTPYLLRAYHEWILDNNCTPYVVVDTYQPEVSVPVQFIQPDGQITLNVSPQATGNLVLGEHAIEFNARFSGQVHHLYVPTSAVMAIFAKETGQGTAFAVTPASDEDKTETEAELTPVEVPPQVQQQSPTEPDDEPEPPTPPKPEKKRGSHLRVVK